MSTNTILARLIALGITTETASRRQSALALADKLRELGDDTLQPTLERKVQSWLADEKQPSALLGVVLTLLEREFAGAVQHNKQQAA